ncbi:MAG: tetratricopeptide repeat protein [Thaumarchaeota archaeon]|nr:tetratricopeptide repeat protein [Nitrososphaerota archaeon]
MRRAQKERRLGAIMFTDMVGYSSISDKDENLALRLLKEHRKLLSAIFPRYGGEVIKTIGDAFLVELASAVQAVNCALEVQKEVKRFNEGRKQNQRLAIRIGIHVGDIVHASGDVLGDAVNIAARVESIAEPGGISVTRQVVDQVRGKVKCRLVSLGSPELKNINNPVEIYKVLPSAKSGQSIEKSALDPRRVAVLPLANMSPDPNDRYLADGLTEELISTISRIHGLSVISRTSVMRYRDTMLPIGQISQELGTGSILEGSVRKAGNKLRITAQLIHAQSDRHIWSETYDRDLSDIFAIQSDIAEKVTEALKVYLLSKERQVIKRKATTTNTEAYTLYLKGRYYWNERAEASVIKAIRYFEEAVKVDPNFALAYTGLADAYFIMSDYLWMSPQKAGPLAEQYASKAIALDDGLAEAHASLGSSFLNNKWDFASSEREYKKAMELRPNYPAAYHWYGILLTFMGRYQDALAMIRRANDLDPYSRALNQAIGVTLYYLRRFDASLKRLDEVIDSNPDYAPAHFWKSIVLVEMGRMGDAIKESRRAVELDGTSGLKVSLAWTYARSGDQESAIRIMNEVGSDEKSIFQPSWAGLVKFELGKKDEAFKLFRLAYETHDTDLLYLRGSPTFEVCQSDPRWAEIESDFRSPKAR